MQLNDFANSLLLNSVTHPPVTGPAWSPEALPVMLEKQGRLTLTEKLILKQTQQV